MKNFAARTNLTTLWPGVVPHRLHRKNDTNEAQWNTTLIVLRQRPPPPPLRCISGHQVTGAADRKSTFLSKRVLRVVHQVSHLGVVERQRLCRCYRTSAGILRWVDLTSQMQMMLSYSTKGCLPERTVNSLDTRKRLSSIKSPKGLCSPTQKNARPPRHPFAL